MKFDINEANKIAFERIQKANNFLVDVKYAHEVIEGMDKYTIGHAGPPIKWEDMCGPMKGAIVGAIIYEGLTDSYEEAEEMAATGKVKFVSNHSMGCVGPMSGMVTYSMPLVVVKNETFGNYAYSTFNEGLGKVMRFGANDESVIKRLKWLEQVFAPVLKKALALSGPINVQVLIAKALAMGDELHQRNVAASSVFARTILPYLVRVMDDKKTIEEVTDFVTGNEQFFLNIAMANSKATMDPVKNIEGSTIVTAMSRNGTNFGIKVSGLGEQWFEAPVNMPQGLYFPGYSEKDANPDMGDSAIVECIGLGGFAMGAAPAVVQFVGAASVQAAIQYTMDMEEITEGTNSTYQMPNMNFQGVPTGIDIRKVVETGILPVINTGMAHKEPGVGQIGAGIVTAPLDCFVKAVMAFSELIEE
ncbi:DUF1116 domain-containing protein [Clostridium malenominatum]|uniref:DUF1116 domain-containing protein n=1 Tax=Clostridium malenominatum TaxID=1539 RepID=A0ABP3UF61_9CLOT